MKSIQPEVLKESIGDAEIQYLSYTGSGPVIIFLHATGFMPWIWHPIARELAESYRIIVPYFCDHRTSEPEQGGLGWMLLAEDLTRLCGNLGLKRPLIVGHSMGGTIATLAAGALNLKPEKMVLFEPIFLPEDFYKIEITVNDHPLAAKSIKRRDAWKDRQEAAEYLKSKPLFNSWDDEMLDIYIQYGMTPDRDRGIVLACSPRKEASLFMGSRQYNPWPIISRVTCPVKIVEGEKSETGAYVDFRMAAETFRNGSHQILKDTGHLIPMEKPRVAIEIIKEFFGAE